MQEPCRNRIHISLVLLWDHTVSHPNTAPHSDPICLIHFSVAAFCDKAFSVTVFLSSNWSISNKVLIPGPVLISAPKRWFWDSTSTHAAPHLDSTVQNSSVQVA